MKQDRTYALCAAGRAGDRRSPAAAAAAAARAAKAATAAPAAKTPPAKQLGGRYGGESESKSASSERAGRKRRRRRLRSPRSGDLGMVLVDSNGMTLYDFHKDKGPRPPATAPAPKAWPPMLTEGEPTAEHGASASKLGTTEAQRRDDAGHLRRPPALHLRRATKSPAKPTATTSRLRRPVVRPQGQRRGGRRLALGQAPQAVRAAAQRHLSIPWFLSPAIVRTKEPRDARGGRTSRRRFLKTVSCHDKRTTQPAGPDHRSRSADVATAQGGVVSLDQLSERGVSRGSSQQNVPMRGSFTAIHRGVYASGIGRCRDGRTCGRRCWPVERVP